MANVNNGLKLLAILQILQVLMGHLLASRLNASPGMETNLLLHIIHYVSQMDIRVKLTNVLVLRVSGRHLQRG